MVKAHGLYPCYYRFKSCWEHHFLNENENENEKSLDRTENGMNKKLSTAKYITEVQISDPDSNMPVNVAIYKESTGGMFGVDSSYVEQEIGKVFSPIGNGELELIDD